MEEKESSLLPLDLPVTDVKKEKERVNCLQEMLIDILNDRGLKDADVVKATGISWSTYFGWVSGQVKTQLADKNLLRLAQYLNVSLEYLCFGIGTDDPRFAAFEEFLDEEKKEKEKDLKLGGHNNIN